MTEMNRVSIRNINLNYHRLMKVTEPYFFVVPGMLLLTALMLLPILRVIWVSFFENSFINPSSPWVGIDNYIQIIENPRFSQVLTNTLTFTVGSVGLHLIIGLGLALLLNQPINPVALSVFRVIFILPWIFTAAVVAISWQIILTPLGVFNNLVRLIAQTPISIEWLGDTHFTMLTLITISAWRGFPFCMVSLLAGLQSISKELYEAAYVDGADSFRTFLHITIPQLRPILLSIGLLDMIWTLNLFPLIWLLTGGGPNGATETIAIFTYKLAFNEFQFGQASAMAVIGVAVTMVITLFYLKYQQSV